MAEILCVIDGMTDPEFCSGDYPNLSAFCPAGRIQTTPEGYEPESLTCILTLLGVSPVPRHVRAWLEAAGAGIPVEDGDLVFRGSWVSLDGNGCCTGLCPAPSAPSFPPGVEYHSLGGYKSILLLKGQAPLAEQAVTVPPHQNLGISVSRLMPQGLPLLTEAVEHSRTVDRILIPWEPSRKAHLPPFPQKAAAVCAAQVVRGIARLLGMELLPLARATGDTDTDLEEKAGAALRAAEAFPFVFLHINGADEAAHRLDREEKQAFLRRVDRAVFAPLLRSGHRVTITSDHGTDCRTGRHLALPQPVFTNFPTE